MTDEQRSHIEEAIKREVESVIKREVRQSLSENQPTKAQRYLPQFITMLIVVGSFFLIIGQYRAHVDELTRQQNALELRVATIDSQGTRFSQQGITVDHMKVVEHEQRLARMDEVIAKLGVIPFQLEQVQKDLTELKNRKSQQQ